MRTHPEDPRFAILDNIKEGRVLHRNGWLARAFRGRFDGAIHDDKVIREIQRRGEGLTPYLEDIFSGDDETTEHVIHAKFENGGLDVPRIFISRQHRSRTGGESRRIGVPKPVLHQFGMSSGLRELGRIFRETGAHFRPIAGNTSDLFIVNRNDCVSETEDMHIDMDDIDSRSEKYRYQYNITNITLGLDLPATVVEADDGKIVRFPDGTPVTLNSRIRHASPVCKRFRAVLSIQPDIWG